MPALLHKLTSGTNGGSSIPASNRLKLIVLKNGWALTALAPDSEQPNLPVGSFCRSWKKWKHNVNT